MLKIAGLISRQELNGTLDSPLSTIGCAIAEELVVKDIASCLMF